MNKTKFTLSVLATFLFIIVCATPSQAVAARTYVAGPGIGNDVNAGSDCPFSAPCRFLNAAFAQTSAGGEIVALTSGVGYGGLTINKAITITGPAGQGGLIIVTAGGTGFTVSAAVSDQVVVQNLSFNGSGAANSTGLSHTSGKLVLKNCAFSQLTTGVASISKMLLVDCDLIGNGTAVQATGTGADTGGPCPACLVSPQTAVRIVGGTINFNTTALSMVNPGAGSGGSNRINIYLFAIGGTNYLTNFSDNAIFMSGTGTGCAVMGSCTQPYGYGGALNPT